METVATAEEVVGVDERVRDVETVELSTAAELVAETARCANLGAVAIVCVGCPMLQFCQKPNAEAARSAVVSPERAEVPEMLVFDDELVGNNDLWESTTSEATTDVKKRRQPLPELEKKSEPSYLDQLLDDTVDVVLARSLEIRSDTGPQQEEPFAVRESESGSGDVAIIETERIEIEQTVSIPETSPCSDEQIKDDGEVGEMVAILSSDEVNDNKYFQQTTACVAEAAHLAVASPNNSSVSTESQFTDKSIETIPITNTFVITNTIQTARPENLNDLFITDIPSEDPIETMEPVFLVPRIEVVPELPVVVEFPSDSEIPVRLKDETTSFEEYVMTPTESPSIDAVEDTPVYVVGEYSDPDRPGQLVSFETDEILVPEEDTMMVVRSVEYSLEIVENLNKTALWLSQTEVRPVDVGVCGSTAILESTGIVPETDVVYEAIIRSNDVLDPELEVSNSSVQVIHQHTIGVLRQLLAMQALSILLVKWRTINRLS